MRDELIINDIGCSKWHGDIRLCMLNSFNPLRMRVTSDYDGHSEIAGVAALRLFDFVRIVFASL